MTELVLVEALALLLLVPSSLARSPRLAQQLRHSGEDAARPVRSQATSPSIEVVGWMLAVTSTVTAVALLVSGYRLGLGWFGVAATFVVTALRTRSARVHVLEVLGDRGSTPYDEQRQRGQRFRGFMMGAFISTWLLRYAATGVAGGEEAGWSEGVDAGLTVIGAACAFAVLASKGLALQRIPRDPS